MGTAIGVPFVAEAAHHLRGLRAPGLRPDPPPSLGRRQDHIPVEFVFQWEDAVAPREHGVAHSSTPLGRRKTMHINPGGHARPAEAASWEQFFQRHLSGEKAGVLRAA
jgi:hypothetical protein